ncbi:hypothetical protein [Geotalea daltonii]|uniref:hypothetical protein n=1 Tax=Geotalea daltonii TaxID=1203471 RepID=UPI000191E166|nr:hypothetical protein [Geotalea daltonii]
MYASASLFAFLVLIEKIAFPTKPDFFNPDESVQGRVCVKPAGVRFSSQIGGAEEERGGVAEPRRTSDDEGNANLAEKRAPF